MPRTIDHEARKAQLAEAVWRIIVERGIGAVSVRAVAVEAGVVPGSLRHIFPTRAQLLEFSAELMVQRATVRIGVVPRSEDHVQDALAVARELLPLTPDSRAELEVNIALIAETPALPALVAIRDHAHQQLAELCIQLVQMLTDRPRDQQVMQQSQHLHALIDGMAIHLLMRPSTDDDAWAISIMHDEIKRIANTTACRS